MTLADLHDIVAFVDPASGRKSASSRKTSSRSADVVVGSDDVGHIFVLHAWAGRIPTTAHTDRIFQLVKDWRPRIVGIDASAMQTLYSDMLLREAKYKQARLPLWPVPMPTHVNKDERIRTVLQPVIASGRLFVLQTQRDLYAELEAFPTGQTRDMVDALAEAVTLLRKPGAKRSEAKERDDYLRFLRESGAPDFFVREMAK